MKGYLAGPMKGYPDGNRPLFDYWAGVLRGRGHEVLSPAEVERPEGLDWPSTLAFFIATDIGYVLEGECVWMIPGWQYSTGAKIELTVALSAAKKVLDVRTEEPIAIKKVRLLVECAHLRTYLHAMPNEGGQPRVTVLACKDCGHLGVEEAVEMDSHFGGIIR